MTARANSNVATVRSSVIVSGGNSHALAVLLASLFVYCSFATWYGSNVEAAGDEPQYLLMMHSLIVDHDFDLANNLANRDYSLFYYGILSDNAISPFSRQGASYNIWPVGFPMIGSPAYAIGLALGQPHAAVAVLVGVFAAFAALNVFLIALAVSGSRRVAWIVWAAICLSLPVASSATNVMTEAVAMFLVPYLFRKLVIEIRSLRNLDAIVCGSLLGVMPWLHPKFLVLLGGFLLIVILNVLRHVGVPIKPVRTISLLIVPVALLLSALALTNNVMFGVPSVFGGFGPTGELLRKQMGAAHDHTFLAALDVLPISSWGLFVDFKEGLFVYSPIYALAIAAAIYLVFIRRDRASASAFLLMTTVYGGLFFSFAWWKGGGGTFPGRYVAPVLPLAAVFLAWYVKRILETRARTEATVLVGALGWSLFNYVWFLKDPAALLRFTASIYDFQFLFPNSRLLEGLPFSALFLTNQGQLALAWTMVLVGAIGWFVARWAKQDRTAAVT